MKISLAVLLVALALAASSQSDCSVTEEDPQWTDNGVVATVWCNGISNPRWWAVTDPCRADAATTANRLNCTGGSCMVGSDVYGNISSCVICCTNTAVDLGFTPDAVLSCTRINVCPTARLEVQGVAKTGSHVEIVTYITTKPQPPAGSVSVTAQHLVGRDTNTMLTVVADGGVYPVPLQGANTYAVIHVVQMPQQNSNPEDRVLYTVNLTSVPKGRFCPGGNTITGSIYLIQVNDSTTAPTSPHPNANSTGVPPDPATCGVAPPKLSGFDIKSLAIGVVIGVVGTVAIVAVVIVFLVAIRCTCCHLKRPRTTDEKSHHSRNGGKHPLLTVNGTPATTPSSEAQHSLGHTSDSTPASTPTDPQDHLLTQQSQNSDASPYEEIAPQSAALFRQRMVATVPPVGGAPPVEVAPSPVRPAPPPPPPPSSLVPHPPPPRIEPSGSKVAMLQSSAPGYLRQEDMVYLSRIRNKGDSYV